MDVSKIPLLKKIYQNLAPPTRTLLRLIVVLVACIIITAFSLFASFTSFMRQSLVNESMNDISIVHTGFENMNNTAKSILLTFYYDYRTQQLMDSKYVDYTQIHKALLNVSSYYQHHPYISTYYFINRGTNYVFCNDGAYTMKDFHDQKLLQILEANDRNIKFKPIARTVLSKSTNAEEKVFTYVYFDVYDGEIDPKIIVINLSEHYFLDQINATLEDGSCVVMLDPEGNQIFTTASGVYTDVGSPADYLTEENAGHSIRTINGQKTIVCFQRFSNATIVKYVPYSQATEFPFGFIRLSFLISAILLAAVFLIIMFSSWKLLRAFAISHAKYNQAQTSNRVRQEQTILKEILLNASPMTLKRLRAEYNDLFGTNQSSRFCVAICKLDRLKDLEHSLSSTYRNSYLYSIVNVTEELFAPLAKARGVILDSSTAAIVFSDLTENFRQETVEETFQSAISMFRQQFQYSFSVAASEVTADINQAYQSACTLIPYRFLLGHQSIIFYSKVASNENLTFPYPSELEHEVSRCISTQQCEKAMEKIDQFIDLAKKASHEDAHSAVHRLIYSIQITMDSLKMSGLELPHNFQQLYAEFYEAEVLEDVRTSLRKTLTSMCANSDASESALQQNEQLIQNVKLYIMEHYSEFNLSLNTLAEQFQTSPNVLGRIFKALAGRPIFQYITQIRLQHAQELLLHSKLTNKEIALSCGFENTSYFYSLFKQELGTTPSEFRKSQK